MAEVSRDDPGHDLGGHVVGIDQVDPAGTVDRDRIAIRRPVARYRLVWRGRARCTQLAGTGAECGDASSEQEIASADHDGQWPG
jgi:hypothetical protein